MTTEEILALASENEECANDWADEHGGHQQEVLKCGGYRIPMKTAAALRQWAEERENFHMDYRMKCDEQTKALHVEIERLQEERTASDLEIKICRDSEQWLIKALAALRKECDREERLLARKWYLRKHSDGYYWKLGEPVVAQHVVADTRAEAARIAEESLLNQPVSQRE